MRCFILALALLCAFSMPALAGDPLKPDPQKTPGATDPHVTQATLSKTVCRRDPKTGRIAAYTGKVRNVDEATKKRIFGTYGIPWSRHSDFEVDHLVSLELGGSNDDKNLWPESYKTSPLNARIKDALEDRLHALVCAGKLRLGNAQFAIRTDWIAAYREYIGPLPK